MVNFKNAKIYKIINTTNNRFYYGATTKRLLCDRMSQHRAKKDSRLQREIGDIYDCKIELVEKVDVEDISALRSIERSYIEEALLTQGCLCVNKNIPGRTKAEYMKEYNQKKREERIKKK